MQYLKQYGEQLVALGYTVLPIRPVQQRARRPRGGHQRAQRSRD
jgi:hypothetical protein